MEWIDLLDTTIKIGLGALLGGVFTYQLNKQTHRQQIEKDILFDNRETLKNVSERFEITYQILLSLVQNWVHENNKYLQKTIDIYKKHGFEKFPSPTEIMEGNFLEEEIEQILKLPEYDSKRSDDVEKIFVELHSLIGILLLNGYDKMADVLNKIIVNVYSIIPNSNYDFAKEDNFQEYMDFHSSLSDNFNEIANLRMDFYKASHLYYPN